MGIYRTFHPTIRDNKVFSTEIENILGHKKVLTNFKGLGITLSSLSNKQLGKKQELKDNWDPHVGKCKNTLLNHSHQRKKNHTINQEISRAKQYHYVMISCLVKHN